MPVDIHEWFQVSRRYRTVARFPPKMSGRAALRQALRQRGEVDHAWVDGLTEQAAGDQYLRVYAPEGDTRVLAGCDFWAFRQAGGDVYRGQRVHLPEPFVPSDYPTDEAALRAFLQAHVVAAIPHMDEAIAIQRGLQEQARRAR